MPILNMPGVGTPNCGALGAVNGGALVLLNAVLEVPKGGAPAPPLKFNVGFVVSPGEAPKENIPGFAFAPDPKLKTGV